MRVQSPNLMLGQEQQDTDSASSRIRFFGMLVGFVDMLMVFCSTMNLVLTIGVIQSIVGSLGYLNWRSVKNNQCIIQSK